MIANSKQCRPIVGDNSVATVDISATGYVCHKSVFTIFFIFAVFDVSLRR